ncbi:MAG TPA: hypothetical protein VHI95_06795 [Acidimicrobiales bacterium]|jgi:hypothetical protein|nr:hypothetical protein [Acidimicrobiales bacterium]
MATIRATCGDCGDVELTTADVRVRVCVDDNAGSYHFRCPSCQMAVVKPAEPRIVDLLAASGVEVFMWRLPAELFEARFGPRIDHDDLLDFHQLLESDSWFEDLVAVVERHVEANLDGAFLGELEFDAELDPEH